MYTCWELTEVYYFDEVKNLDFETCLILFFNIEVFVESFSLLDENFRKIVKFLTSG